MKSTVALHLILAILSLLGVLRTESAAQLQPGDSLRPYPLDEVIVSASRTGASQSRLPLRTTIVTREMINEGNASGVGDALRLIPGVVIREYGGGEGIQTLSFRGMSSEQTLILIDGVPANSLQTGLIDLRMLPLSDVTSIEVVRGGMSSLYGSNAMGGMINLRTDDSPASSYVRVGGHAGSFKATGVSLSARVPFGTAMLTAGISRDRGSGRFPVHTLVAGTHQEGTRENSDYRSEHLFLRADWSAPDGGKRDFVALSATSLDRGTPGPLVTLDGQGDGRQWDAAIIVIGGSEGLLMERLHYSLTGSAQRADERYVDKTGLFRGENAFRNLLVGFSPMLHYDAGENWTLTTGWDLDAASAAGDALRTTERRSHVAWFTTAEWNSDSDGSQGVHFSLVPALRWETFSSSRPVWNPQLGANVRYSFGGGVVRAHGSAGRSFRVPTINELYYAGAGGYGNSVLSPEVARSIEAGLTFESHAAGYMRCDLTAYTTTTEDRIVWQPAGSSFLWSPVNIARSRSRGIECEAAWTELSGVAEVFGSYAYVDSRNLTGSEEANPAYDKQLPFVPLETASFGLQARVPISEGLFRRILLRLEDQYLGQRFTTDDNSEYLIGIHCLAGNIGAMLDCFGGTILLKYEVANLGDSIVEGMPGYPLPLRHHRVSFTLEKEL